MKNELGNRMKEYENVITGLKLDPTLPVEFIFDSVYPEFI